MLSAQAAKCKGPGQASAIIASMADGPRDRQSKRQFQRYPSSAFWRACVVLALGLSLSALLAACASSQPGPTRAAEERPAQSVTPSAPEPSNAQTSVVEPSPQDKDVSLMPSANDADEFPETVVSRELVTTWRISRGPGGEPSNGPALDVGMSADGRYVAFTSTATNLVPGDDNGVDDVFLFDAATGETRLVSSNLDGLPGDGWSSGPAVSADGRYVAFYSWASDLVPGDVNAVQDVYVYDRIGDTIERVSVAADGLAANDRSGDGRSGARPAISADGRVIAFHSRATNLVDQDTNQAQDIFVYDRGVRQVTRVSVSTHASQGSGDSSGPALSADGRMAAFASRAQNLDLYHPNPTGTSQVYVHDRESGETTLVSAGPDGTAGDGDSLSPALSGDGRTVAFSSRAANLIADDANDSEDIFLYDLQTGKTERVSVNSAGTPGDRDSASPALSLDGRYVGYASAASNLVNDDGNSAVDIFVYDRLTRHTGRASVGVTGPWTGVEADDDSSGPPALSAGGRLVTFVSRATNLAVDGSVEAAEVYALERTDLPSHAVSGRVLDAKNRPVTDVAIAIGPHRAVTGSDGRYTLDHVAGGTYTLTPSREGYSFAPARRTVSVVGDVGGVDFTGLNGGSSALAFLALPIGDAPSTSEFLQALRDTEDGGWVDAWFDHDAPDYTKNGAVSLWDGRERSAGAYNALLGCYERRCYDGHDGIDFPYQDPNRATPGVYEPQLVHPAAEGRVAGIVRGCAAGDRWCNGGYGNEAIVYHDNGFFTRYSHLASTETSAPLRLSAPVTTEDVLGVLGSTGNSFGAHLHFAVHQDDGNGKWDGEEVDLPVDPFGWSGVQPDPWAENAPSAVSRWMWNEHPTLERLLFGSHGATLRDLTGAVIVTVPPGAVAGQVRLELAPGAPAAAPVDAMRSLGRTFWLRVLDWYPPTGDSAAGANLVDAALALPMELVIDLRDEDVRHLDMDRALVQRWDARNQRWQPLPTMVAEDGRKIRASSDRLGNFDLQAPLLCDGDSLEPDDGYFAATYVEPGDDPLHRLFDLDADEDWVQFDAVRGQGIRVSVDQIADGVALVAEIYGLDGLTALAAAESVDGRPVQLAWSPPDDGTYFVRIAPVPGSRTGCAAAYSIAVD